MNRELLNTEVQEFIENYFSKNFSKIAFKGSPFENVSVQELLVQLSGKQKAEKKLPTWFSTRNIIYPPNINLEQTSSEITAEYKAQIVEGCNSVADLTGGLGIDSYFFSKKVNTVHHLELSADLQEVAAHNFGVLGANNINSEAKDGLEFLKNHETQLDWVYLDPSRRKNSGDRVFKLSDCQPNVPEFIDLIFAKGRNILLKTSPLLDISAGLKELKNVVEVHIIAVENEVKELLWILSRRTPGNVRIQTINFSGPTKQIFSAIPGSGFEEQYGSPSHYLYEPNAALMKSGLFAALGAEFKLNKLHPNSHLFTSKNIIDFPGRSFEIMKVLPFRKKLLRKTLDLDKANITIRNFPETVETIRKELKIKDGGEYYLFFTTLETDDKVVIVCKKTTSSTIPVAPVHP